MRTGARTTAAPCRTMASLTLSSSHIILDKDMDIEKTVEQCLDYEEEIVLADGFEEAFMGIARQFGKPFAVYNFEKCIEILSREMTEDDALEYFYYNVEGAWVGKNTPAFMSWADPDDEILVS